MDQEVLEVLEDREVPVDQEGREVLEVPGALEDREVLEEQIMTPGFPQAMRLGRKFSRKKSFVKPVRTRISTSRTALPKSFRIWTKRAPLERLSPAGNASR